MTGLLLDGTYHMNHIKKGSARTPLGIVDKFDTYKTALKNTLLNKFAIETPNNKLQEVTLQDGPRNLITFLALLWIMQHYTAERILTTKYKKTKVVNYRQQNDNLNILETCTFLDCDQYRTNYDGHINITRQK